MGYIVIHSLVHALEMKAAFILPLFYYYCILSTLLPLLASATGYMARQGASVQATVRQSVTRLLFPGKMYVTPCELLQQKGAWWYEKGWKLPILWRWLSTNGRDSGLGSEQLWSTVFLLLDWARNGEQWGAGLKHYAMKGDVIGWFLQKEVPHLFSKMETELNIHSMRWCWG